MADLTVTAASVVASATATVVHGSAGATITAGQAVYFDSSAGTWKLAQADGTAAEAGSSNVGIALHGAASGQPLAVCTRDADFTPGATLTEGELYLVSATAGGIMPEADAASTNYVTLLGVATTATKLYLAPIVSGGQVP